MIRGIVTVGSGNRPAPAQFIRLDEAGGPAPDDLREKGDRFVRDVGPVRCDHRLARPLFDSRRSRHLYRYGPAADEDEKITVKNEAEIVRDFQMPRPEKGTITGRVVFASAGERESPAQVEIVAANKYSVPFTSRPTPTVGSSPNEGSTDRAQADLLLDRDVPIDVADLHADSGIGLVPIDGDQSEVIPPVHRGHAMAVRLERPP